jgi:hypothetical protein
MNGLSHCTKYKVQLLILNIKSNKSFTYNNFVTTKPDAKDTKIHLKPPELVNDSAIFNWKANSASCFVNYQLILKDELQEVVYNNTFENTSTTVDISSLNVLSSQIFAFDDKGIRIASNEQKFNYIINVAVENDENNVTLSWTTNYTKTHEKIFHVKIMNENSNEIVMEIDTSKQSVIAKNLTHCCKYSVEISSNFTLKKFKTTFTTIPAMPNDVSNVKLEVKKNETILTWDPPTQNPFCVQNYTIIYETLNEIPENGSTTTAKPIPTYSVKYTRVLNSTLKSSKFPHLSHYRYKNVYVRVIVNQDTSLKADAGRYELDNIYYDDLYVDTFKEFRLSPTEVQISWNNQWINWEILKEYEIIFNNETLHTKTNWINLRIQACKKNYTISVRCVFQNEKAGPSVTYTTNLNDDDVQLSAIRDTDIKITQMNKTILLSWMPNADEQECIKHYEVDFLNRLSTTIEPKMEIDNIELCTPYEIFITPVSFNDTRGKTTKYEFSTSVLGKFY